MSGIGSTATIPTGEQGMPGEDVLGNHIRNLFDRIGLDLHGCNNCSTFGELVTV
jgi:hypothetical protein